MPRPEPVQRLGFYVEAPTGGCSDIGVLQMAPGVGLYHHAHIREAIVAERIHVIPYLLSVLEVLRK